MYNPTDLLNLMVPNVKFDEIITTGLCMVSCEINGALFTGEGNILMCCHTNS